MKLINQASILKSLVKNNYFLKYILLLSLVLLVYLHWKIIFNTFISDSQDFLVKKKKKKVRLSQNLCVHNQEIVVTCKIKTFPVEI